MYWATGSPPLIAAPRLAWLVAKYPDRLDRRLFQSVKNNLANDTQGTAFSIVEGVLHWEADPIKEDSWNAPDAAQI